MKEQCMMCGSIVEDVSGVCPVCGAVLTRSRQAEETKEMQFHLESGSGQQQGEQPQSPNGPYGVAPNGPYGTASNGPYGGVPAAPKKKVFAILSLVFSILALISCCVPVLQLVFAIVAVVFAILALAKKQVKPPAIIGLIIGILALFTSIGIICCNLLFRSVMGTDFKGMMEQMIDAESEGCTPLEDILFENPYDNHYYVLNSYGTYNRDDYVSGSYNCYDYVEYSSSNGSSGDISYAVIYVMHEGYEVKDVTILDFGSYVCVFVVPDDYEAGDTIYYVDGNGSADMDDYELVPVPTMDTSDLY